MDVREKAVSYLNSSGYCFPVSLCIRRFGADSAWYRSENFLLL